MRSLIILFFALGINGQLLAQKNPLDYAASGNWPRLIPLAISNNGKYVAYQLDAGARSTYLVAQATDREWKRTFSDFGRCEFTPDSRRLIIQNKHDSLGILEMARGNVKYIDFVKSFQLVPGNAGLLGLTMRDPGGGFCVYNLQTRETRRYEGVDNYIFNPQGNVLLLEVKKSGTANLKSLIWVNLDRDTSFRISTYFAGHDFKFNEKGNTLVFLVTDSVGRDPSTSLKLYKPGMDSAITAVDSSIKGMNGWAIQDGILEFDKTGYKIYFSVIRVGAAFSGTFYAEKGKIAISNYKAEKLSNTFGEQGEAVVHLSEKVNYVSIIRCGEDTRELPLILDAEDKYALVANVPIGLPASQNGSLRWDWYLVSVLDGSRKLLRRNAILDDIGFSPTGKYIIWFDRESREWSIYRVKDHRQTSTGKSLPEPLFRECDNLSDRLRSVGKSAEGIVGWLVNDSNVIVNGRYDLWKVDPDGRRGPLNVTLAYGITHGIRFRVVNLAQSRFLKDTLLLSAFDVRAKENGFYQLVLGTNSSLTKLSMGKYMYAYPDRYSIELGSNTPDIIDQPLKAKDSTIYLVQRMSTSEYPNLFVTTNFRTFEPITNLAPEKKYNWYSTQLIRYSLPSGRQSEGILFKPENFDSSRKYPVIFYYYERNADALNVYLLVNLSSGCLNIPWFVSNGYLVFVPDIIYYKSGFPGESAYQSVNSAADALTRFPWVDEKALGLQGHSFGGWETNYIVTRTSRFKAAASAAAVSDEVSCYGQYSVDDNFFTSRQGRLWASLGQNPGVYIQNSPIYHANKISTPLFLMHGVKDLRVNREQALEFYRTLASLQKKVWLIQYSDEGHILQNEESRLDYSIRLAQFFNYYLKNVPPAKWMTFSNSLSRESEELKLDYTGAKP